MKHTINTLLGAISLLPSMVFADVTVSLHRDVEAIVVAGEELPLTVKKKSRFILPDGENQLVVRVSKLVEKGSEFDKFRSDPLVINFTGFNSEITISPSRMIRLERDIKDFKTNPSVILENQDKERIAAAQEILPRGAGLTRDYAKELAKFNAKSDYSESTAEQVVPKQHSVILLKADFLRLDENERKDFLKWAIENS